MKRLDGIVAVITGGAGGIGKAIVRLFVQEGARIVIADIDTARGELLARELGAAAVYQQTDMRQESDVQAALARAVNQFGRLDCLCNNAGVAWAMRPIEDILLEDFESIMDSIVRSAFLGMKHAAPIMRQQGAGNIINIAGIAGLLAGHGTHMHSAAKAAVIQLTQSVAMELGESGIRVNCICPAGAVTSACRRVCDNPQNEAEKAMNARMEEVTTHRGSLHPIKRACLPEDVAEAALWLASDDSGFVNGHALVIDGGATCGRPWSTTLEEAAELRTTLLSDPQQ